jgi:hypothetical protein
MRLRVCTLLLLGVLVAWGAGPDPAPAQEVSPPVNVSNSPGTSRQPHLAVADDGALHIAWADDSGAAPGVTRIWYSRSFDHGQSFTSPRQISTGVSASLRPRLAVFGPAVFLVWMQDPDAAQESNTKEVMFARSLDQGETFSPPANLSNTPGNSQEARVAVGPGGTLFVVWDEESPSRHIALVRSFDGGASFEGRRAVAPVATPPGCAPGAVGNCATIYPGLAVDRVSGSVYVVWHDLLGSQPQVLFSRSLDNGVSFSAPLNVSHASIHAHCASVNVGPSGRVLVAFEARKTLALHTHDAMFAQSTDGGATFGTPVNLSHSPEATISDYPWAVEGPDGTIVAGWEDNAAGGRTDAVAAVSRDGGASFSPPVDISNNPDSESTEVVTLFAPDGTFYMVWEDYAAGQGEVLLFRARGGSAGPPPPAPPVQPVVTAPADGAVLRPGETITLAWTAVPGAELYGLEFTGVDRRFGNPNGAAPDPTSGYGGAGGGLLVSGTQLSGVLPPVPPGSYQIRVIGLTAGLGPVGRFSDARTVSVADAQGGGGGGGGDDGDDRRCRRRPRRHC